MAAIFRTLPLLLLLLLATTPVRSDNGAITHRLTGNNACLDVRPLDAPNISRVCFRFDVALKIWTLLKEPVYDARVKWQIDTITAIDPDNPSQSWTVPGYALQDPKAIHAIHDIRLDLDLYAYGTTDRWCSDRGNFNCQIVGVGVFFKPDLTNASGGDYAYATPTSPRGDRFMERYAPYRRTSVTQPAPNFMDRETAVQVIEAGFTLETGRVSVVNGRIRGARALSNLIKTSCWGRAGEDASRCEQKHAQDPSKMAEERESSDRLADMLAKASGKAPQSDKKNWEFGTPSQGSGGSSQSGAGLTSDFLGSALRDAESERQAQAAFQLATEKRTAALGVCRTIEADVASCRKRTCGTESTSTPEKPRPPSKSPLTLQVYPIKCPSGEELWRGDGCDCLHNFGLRAVNNCRARRLQEKQARERAAYNRFRDRLDDWEADIADIRRNNSRVKVCYANLGDKCNVNGFATKSACLAAVPPEPRLSDFQ